MARYIDADLLIENIVKIEDLRTLSTKTIGEAISNTPTANVVEVVRCKDCEHAYICGDKVYCRNTETPWYNDYFEVFTETTDFCSYGTPKERGGEK